jgi:hypothetical protein
MSPSPCSPFFLISHNVLFSQRNPQSPHAHVDTAVYWKKEKIKKERHQSNPRSPSVHLCCYRLLLRGGIARTATISDLLCDLISVLIIPIHPPELPGNYQQTPSNEVGEMWREMAVNFVYEVPLFIPVGIFKMPQNLMTRDRRLYIPSEETCPKDLIALKIHRLCCCFAFVKRSGN